MKHIMFCEKCKNYTMNAECCGGVSTVNVKPPRFVQNKTIQEYRIKAKKCGK